MLPIIPIDRKAFVDDLMTRVHREWRYRWCRATMTNPCACIGAANCSGHLAERGVTQIEWQDWVQRHTRRRKNRRGEEEDRRRG